MLSRFIEQKHLIENFLSLSVLRGVNILLPLISFPYLLRVIGPSNFGIVAFVQAYIEISMVFLNYGFNFSATKEVSLNRSNLKYVSELFWAVIFFKFILLLLNGVVLFFLYLSFNKFHNNIIMFLFSLGILLGNILIPIWFFQGIEKMKYIMLVNIIPKTFFTIMIFIFINNEGQYIYVPLLNGIGSLIAGMVAIAIVSRKFKIQFCIPTYISLKRTVVDGSFIFVSLLSVSFYRSFNVIILSVLTNDFTVGIYASAEKIVKIIQSFISPFTEVLYPFLSRKFATIGVKNKIDILFKTSLFFTSLLFIISFLTFFFSDVIIITAFSNKYYSSIINLKILSLVILFGGINYFLGINGLVCLGFQRNFTKYIVFSSFIGLIIIILSSKYLLDLAGSISMVISEFILCLLILYFFITKKFNSENV